MGRKSGYKWLVRIRKYQLARAGIAGHIAERLHWVRLFGRHRKFNP